MNNDLKHRLLIWIEALKQSYYFLCINDSIDCGQEDFSVYLNGNHQFSKNFMIKEALMVSAIIYFSQMFTSGNPGIGFAPNSSQDIKDIKDKMKAGVINKLGWSTYEYDDFIQRIKNMRDGFVAHYDGNKANYKKITPFLSSFQMLGACNLDNNDIDKLKQLTVEMYNYLIEYITINS